MVYFYEWSYIDMINEYHHRINILPFSYGFLGDRDFPWPGMWEILHQESDFFWVNFPIKLGNS